jgi:hypothetical protein
MTTTKFPNVPYQIVKTVGQSSVEDQFMVFMGPLTNKQLKEMGMVKDSSITKK